MKDVMEMKDVDTLTVEEAKAEYIKWYDDMHAAYDHVNELARYRDSVWQYDDPEEFEDAHNAVDAADKIADLIASYVCLLEMRGWPDGGEDDT